MIPQPICVISPTWVAIIISIVGWFVVHGLSIRRDRILNMESQKREFLMLMHQLRRDAVQAGKAQSLIDFYKSTLTQIDDAITMLGLVCEDKSVALNDAWIAYSRIDTKTLDAKNDGSDGLAMGLDGIKPAKTSTILPPYFDQFIEIIKPKQDHDT